MGYCHWLILLYGWGWPAVPYWGSSTSTGYCQGQHHSFPKGRTIHTAEMTKCVSLEMFAFGNIRFAMFLACMNCITICYVVWIPLLSGFWSWKDQWRTDMGATADWSYSWTGHSYCLTGHGGSNPFHVRRYSMKMTLLYITQFPFVSIYSLCVHRCIEVP